MPYDLDGEKFAKEVIAGEFEILICSLHMGDSGSFNSLLCKIGKDTYNSISLTMQHLQWLFTGQYDRLIQECKNDVYDNDRRIEECWKAEDIKNLIQYTWCMVYDANVNGEDRREFRITNYDNFAYSDLLA